jgi:hypothetical protein
MEVRKNTDLETLLISRRDIMHGYLCDRLCSSPIVSETIPLPQMLLNSQNGNSIVFYDYDGYERGNNLGAIMEMLNLGKPSEDLTVEDLKNARGEAG